MIRAVGIGDVDAAAARLRGIARVTPVVTSDRSFRVQLKCENLQRSRAFKFRGIYNRMALLGNAERAAGVVIVSSGNAGLAAAVAGRILDVATTVVVSDTALQAKVDAIRTAGATVIAVHGSMEDVFERARALAAEDGAVLIHAFDDADVIAGQGTIALEVIEQVPDLACFVVPTSGGSMLAGSVVALRASKPEVRIIGVEAEGAAALAASLAAGRIVQRETVQTIADGLAYPSYGTLNFDIAKGQVDDVLVVDDDEILRAMAIAWTEFGIAVEPAAATALAGVQKAGLQDSETTVAVMSGGNVDLDLLRHALAGGTAAEWAAPVGRR